MLDSRSAWKIWSRRDKQNQKDFNYFFRSEKTRRQAKIYKGRNFASPDYHQDVKRDDLRETHPILTSRSNRLSEMYMTMVDPTHPILLYDYGRHFYFQKCIQINFSGCIICKLMCVKRCLLSFESSSSLIFWVWVWIQSSVIIA